MACDKVQKSIKENNDYQDLKEWPAPPPLETLISRISANKEDLESSVRVYTVSSTRLDKDNSLGKIRHTGSGPNLEGGVATLSTCKRSMRQARPIEYWENSWLLGLTSRARSNGFNGKHYLLYLMKVEKACNSQQELYDYLETTYPLVLEIKSAVANPLGDVFIPKRSCSDPLNPASYETPHRYHSHGHLPGEEWEEDISLNTSKSRVGTPMLVGDPNNTYVWRKPIIYFTEDRGSGSKIILMKDLLFGEYLRS